MDVLGIRVIVFIHDAPNLATSPGYILRAFLASRRNLGLPEFALIITVESQRTSDFFQSLGPFAPSHQDCGRNQDKMPGWVNYRLKVNALEIRSSPQPVPESNRLTDRLI